MTLRLYTKSGTEDVYNVRSFSINKDGKLTCESYTSSVTSIGREGDVIDAISIKYERFDRYVLVSNIIQYLSLHDSNESRKMINKFLDENLIGTGGEYNESTVRILYKKLDMIKEVMRYSDSEW